MYGYTAAIILHNIEMKRYNWLAEPNQNLLNTPTTKSIAFLYSFAPSIQRKMRGLQVEVQGEALASALKWKPWYRCNEFQYLQEWWCEIIRSYLISTNIKVLFLFNPFYNLNTNYYHWFYQSGTRMFIVSCAGFRL